MKGDEHALNWERLVDLCSDALWFDAEPKHVARWAETQGIRASAADVIAARQHPRARSRIAAQQKLDEDFYRRWDTGRAAE